MAGVKRSAGQSAPKTAKKGKVAKKPDSVSNSISPARKKKASGSAVKKSDKAPVTKKEVKRTQMPAKLLAKIEKKEVKTDKYKSKAKKIEEVSDDSEFAPGPSLKGSSSRQMKIAVRSASARPRSKRDANLSSTVKIEGGKNSVQFYQREVISFRGLTQKMLALEEKVAKQDSSLGARIDALE